MLAKLPLNKFLQSRAEINQCTHELTRAGLKLHGLDCKNFDLRNIIPYLRDGNGFCDLGAAGSFILHNHSLLGLGGRRVGIDLVDVAEHDRTSGVEYFKGSLMNTPFNDAEFDQICCLSVIEHEVDYTDFAKEVSRLLKSGGDAFVSFDYCEPKVDTSKTKLFDLNWNILSRADAEKLIDVCGAHGLRITSPVDWTTSELVINPTYCSPAQVSYTFGLFHFKKD